MRNARATFSTASKTRQGFAGLIHTECLMPWIDANFSADANSSGAILNTQQVSAPLSGTLSEYRVTTTTGCMGRAHDASLTVTRSDDPSDTLDISVTVPDCTEVDNPISPAYQ